MTLLSTHIQNHVHHSGIRYKKKIFDLSSSNNIVELYVFSIQIKTQRKSNIEIERLKRIFIV